jgi:hypothetical protein
MTPSDSFAFMLRALEAAFPVDPLLASAWVLSAIVAAVALVYGWQRLLDRNGRG